MSFEFAVALVFVIATGILLFYITHGSLKHFDHKSRNTKRDAKFSGSYDIKESLAIIEIETSKIREYIKSLGKRKDEL